jgi:hypothetical protein
LAKPGRERTGKACGAAGFSPYEPEGVYTKSYSAGYTFDAFKQLTRYDTGVVSPLYFCFTPSIPPGSPAECTILRRGRFFCVFFSNRWIFDLEKERMFSYSVAEKTGRKKDRGKRRDAGGR